MKQQYFSQEPEYHGYKFFSFLGTIKYGFVNIYKLLLG